jgi:hypothetical protein
VLIRLASCANKSFVPRIALIQWLVFALQTAVDSRNRSLTTNLLCKDILAVDVGGVADHNAGRFRLPTAQADMGAERESGRVRFRRLGHGTSVVAFSFPLEPPPCS